MTTRVALLLLLCMCLLMSACGSPSEEQEFKSGFDQAVKAAEKGKEIVKSPTGRRP